MQEPAYKFEDFVTRCCDKSANFFIRKGAKVKAASDFGLYTDDEILKFIGNGGLEKPEFINSKKWEKNPDKEKKILVDAYHFFSGMKYGYFAFLFNHKTNRWMIKSFKEDKETLDPRNLPFKNLSLDLINKVETKDGQNE